MIIIWFHFFFSLKLIIMGQSKSVMFLLFHLGPEGAHQTGKTTFFKQCFPRQPTYKRTQVAIMFFFPLSVSSVLQPVS